MKITGKKKDLEIETNLGQNEAQEKQRNHIIANEAKSSSPERLSKQING